MNDATKQLRKICNALRFDYSLEVLRLGNKRNFSVNDAQESLEAEKHKVGKRRGQLQRSGLIEKIPGKRLYTTSDLGETTLSLIDNGNTRDECVRRVSSCLRYKETIPILEAANKESITSLRFSRNRDWSSKQVSNRMEDLKENKLLRRAGEGKYASKAYTTSSLGERALGYSKIMRGHLENVIYEIKN